MSRLATELTRLLTRGDKLLIGLLLLTGLGSSFLFHFFSSQGQTATIMVQNRLLLRKNLSENRVFKIRGAMGQTTIEISDSAIRVLDSDCPQKLCVHQGKISRTGEVVVCVPNKITIWIEGSRKNKFDAVTG
ncbi:MAG: NusG domain II-containing protein [bacterium]